MQRSTTNDQFVLLDYKIQLLLFHISTLFNIS